MKNLSIFLLLIIPISAQAQDGADAEISKEKIQALGWMIGNWEWKGIYEGEEFNTTWECEWIFDNTVIECLDNGNADYKGKYHYGYNRLVDEYFVLSMWSGNGMRVSGQKGRVTHNEGTWYEYFETENNGQVESHRFVYKPGGDEIGIEQYNSIGGMPEKRDQVATMTRID